MTLTHLFSPASSVFTGGNPAPSRLARAGFAALFLGCASLVAPPLAAQDVTSQFQISAFKQAVAEAASVDESIGAFYRNRDYAPLFTGESDGQRRGALLRALASADDHGLPSLRYDPEELRAAFAAAGSTRERGKVEVMAAQMLVQFSRDLQSGATEPRRIDSGIVRDIPRRAPEALLADFASQEPITYFRTLMPRTPEYVRLMRGKLELENRIAQGGWGPQVQVKALEPGQQGPAVVALRNRLIAMGYLGRSATQTYDAAITRAVQTFQIDHGLSADGVAGPGTIAALNVSPVKRLESVIVAMERERWLNRPRGARHVLVNIPSFKAQIIDNGKVTFETRSVVGKNVPDQRTPEFSDTMEHMVINPTWNVPRSIATKEYLPLFQRNPNAAGHLKLIDRRGRVVPRGAVNFRAYNARNFPFAIKQPPSRSNALGLVKFMFPNKYNIYLHDTPSKSLFNRDVRAFSHGCIRLADPFDFAYALLARQTDDPKGTFQSLLRTGAESMVKLDVQIPVHLIYRTAFTQARGHMNYRDDIYGRDARIWNAMAEMGVKLRGVES
ncbi:murein L,D-transpeptidase [Oceanicola sp. 502str15]|uniref:L,D-transpeptidase family protein n=1 Tax=Oceanicola sp. 502str15 TaxID=2696061 RepID=UPI0020940FE0|nr:L,D-transpeptidase family protein [Oceanicola sp. 502str15]MCO6381964.1 L,D-transpeptidase family protein [Oceanicola sp. 502str15]